MIIQYPVINLIINNTLRNKMHEEGFEPSHLTVLDLKTSALDHSAIRALKVCLFAISFFKLLKTVLLCCKEI